MFKIINIPVSSKPHPPPKYESLPNHAYTMGIIAPPGSGKTNLLCNLLIGQAGYFHQIFIVSPSIKNDDKWHYIKKQKLLVENKPLKKFLKKLQDDESSDDEEEIVKKPKTSYVPQEEEEFSPYIPEENYMNDYDENTIKQLWDQQQGHLLGNTRDGRFS